MVKTVTLAADTPQKITFEGAYPYYWIDNKTASDVYASVGGTPEADKDDTYTITAGSQLRISGGVGNDGITLLGEGKVQIIASTIAACPFKSTSGGGGIQSINGIISNGGKLALTQSDIPSDGKAYQMPYYVQGGTLSGGDQLYRGGCSVIFERKYKTKPLVLAFVQINRSDLTIHSLSANIIDLTESGMTVKAWYVGDYRYTGELPGTAEVSWIALGELEDTNGQADSDQ